jgi:hypothetical protein
MRPRTSSAHLFVVLLMMFHPIKELETPADLAVQGMEKWLGPGSADMNRQDVST